jgi:hypothetical protein
VSASTAHSPRHPTAHHPNIFTHVLTPDDALGSRLAAGVDRRGHVQFNGSEPDEYFPGRAASKEWLEVFVWELLQKKTQLDQAAAFAKRPALAMPEALFLLLTMDQSIQVPAAATAAD